MGEVEDHEHVWSETEIPATCTEPGILCIVCVLCGAEEVAELPAPGHSFAAPGPCDRCGAVEEREEVPEETPEKPQETGKPEQPKQGPEEVPENGEEKAEEAPEEETAEVVARVEPAASYSQEGLGCEYYAYSLPVGTLWAFGHLDPGYIGSAVTDLTEREAQSVKNAILLSRGEDPVGCLAAAQVIHDQYVYLGGGYASFRTLERVITGWWDPAAWSDRWVNPESLNTAAAEAAFDYIFCQGNAFLPHNLSMMAELPDPAWDPQDALPGTEAIGLLRLEGAAGPVYLGLWGYSPCDTGSEWSVNPEACLRWSLGSDLSTREELQAELIRRLYDSDEGMVTCDFDGYNEIEGRHEGIDFALEAGCPLYAVTEGQILRVNPSADLSTLAVYDERSDKTVVYLHLAISEELQEGDILHRGDFIGVESSCGADSAHTHVEVVEGASVCANISVAANKESVYYEMGMTLENEDPYYYWAQALSGARPEGSLRHMTDHPIVITWPWPGAKSLVATEPEKPAPRAAAWKDGSLIK